MDTFYDVKIPTEALYAYHAPERQLYRRMVLDIGINPRAAMLIIAFWLWLEEAGHQPGVIARVSGFDDSGILTVASLGYAAVGCLNFDQADPPAGLPLQSDQVREHAVRGIRYFLRNVCCRAFDDITREAEESRTRRRGMEVLVQQQMSQAFLDAGSAQGAAEWPVAMPHGGTGRGTNHGDRMKGANQGLLLSGNSFRPNAHGVEANTNAAHGMVVPNYVPYGEGSSERGAGNTRRLPPGILDLQGALQLQFDQHLNALLPRGDIGIPQVQLFFGGGNTNIQLIGGARDVIGAEVETNHDGSQYYLVGRRKSDTSRPSRPWSRRRHCKEQDERTLFVTFSNGYPLTEEDLYEFFMRNYGDVEMVEVPIPDSGRILYGSVAFYSLTTLFRVLDGKFTAKFMCRGRHLWARRYNERMRTSQRKAR